MCDAICAAVARYTSRPLTGLVGSLFDVGTVYFQTAGATAEIEFDSIREPRIIQDILYDLLDSKKKGDI